ncbi:uncharacterized protein LOC124268356 [Haliotis rubra]|uniref:uncharacterized protein LOC124268356 n=1 Tax=Haliotis rubra TaxID=36100 RepID=UPI001EE58D80|nr:uncharacterized protein LOC124268356 [Haliotis rubra]
MPTFWLIFIASTLGIDSARGTCVADCDWSVGEWGGCSRSCGGGYQTRNRTRCCHDNESTEACQERCQSKSVGDVPDTNRSCNKFCFNGGTFDEDTSLCRCKQGWTSTCCQEAPDAGRYKCEEVPNASSTDDINQNQQQRELLPEEFTGYRFFVLTGSNDNPSCSLLRMYIEGERGSASGTCLHPSRPALWMPGKTGDDITAQIGNIKLIFFEPDTGCAWRPAGVTMTNIQSSQSQYFSCAQSVEESIRTIRRVRAAFNRRIEVRTFTSDIYLAGTDSDLFVTVHGRTGSSNEKRLSGSFERNDRDDTNMDIGDIGRLYKVRIRSDNSGWLSGWHLNKIAIYEDHGALEFQCNCWIGGSDPLEKTLTVDTECRSIDYCGSQRCYTCSACLPSDSRYFYRHISYANKCYRCQFIANCQRMEECGCNDCQVCSRCEGIVIDTPGHRAYVASNDRKHCRKACSWRPDSTWCYPGTCQEELASNCICSPGFSGSNCQNIDTPPVISWNRIVVHGQGNETAEAPVDPNNAEAQEDSWTNLKNIHNINYDFHTSFIPSGLQPSRHNFIDGYKVGIKRGKVTITIFKGLITSFSTVINCENVSELAPHRGLFKCFGDVNVTSSELTTGNVVQFQFVTSSGGFVKVKNMENNKVQTHYYAGQSKTATMRIGIDYVNPYHCNATWECSADMLIVGKTSKQPSFNVQWNGWRDDTSGIRSFEFQVFEMEFIVSEDGLRIKK